MDKINLSQWDRIFGNTRQETIFSSDHFGEHHFFFKEAGLASGNIQHITTPGMQLVALSIDAGKPFQLAEEASTESAESVFVLEGAVTSSFHNLASPVQLNKNHHNLQYNPAFGGEHTITSPGFHAITINYNLEFLQRLQQPGDNKSLLQLGNSIEKKKTWMAANNALHSQGRVNEIIQNIKECRFTGAMKYIFLESKMLELFVLQLEQANAINYTNKKQAPSDADREKLYAVKEYIDNSFLETFSLKSLAMKFGLNEFKLKKGYRHFFQNTVFGQVHELRLQKAKSLLMERQLNVTEAAFFVGYNNVSSFCTEFRKKFGFSPGKIHVN